MEEEEERKAIVTEGQWSAYMDNNYDRVYYFNCETVSYIVYNILYFCSFCVCLMVEHSYSQSEREGERAVDLFHLLCLPNTSSIFHLPPSNHNIYILSHTQQLHYMKHNTG